MRNALRVMAPFAMAVALVAGVSALVLAGSDAKAPGQDMAAMIAEMQKCAVCKHMVAGLPEFGPSMKSEIVHLPDGMAMIHTITDPTKVAVYHAAAAEVAKAGEAAMTMTPEQIKTQLCSNCQEMVGMAMAGASISHGMTKDGDILIITAKDPALIARINAYQTKCEQMLSSM
jgi:hypothetical protein